MGEIKHAKKYHDGDPGSSGSYDDDSSDFRDGPIEQIVDTFFGFLDGKIK